MPEVAVAEPTAAPQSNSPNFDEAFSGLEEIAGVKPEPTQAPAPKPSDKAPVTTQKPTQEKPPEQKSPQTPPATPEAPKVKAKTLAEAKEMAQAEAKEWRTKYESLQQELSKPKDDPEKKTLAERLEAREKRLAELEQELRYSAYERSEEYKDKYEQPFLSAYTAARSKIASLKVRDGRAVDHDGNVVSEGTWRQGAPEDFDTLMRIQDDETAADYAEKVFGNKASIALFHRERAQELNRQRLTAIDDYRKKGSEHEKLTKETTQKQQAEITTQLQTFWKKHQSDPVEKFPHLFKPIDGDEKGNAELQKGFDMATRAFASLHRVNDPTISPQERESLIANHAAVFNWAMAGRRLAFKNSEMTKELTELKAKLKQYEDSEPSGGITRKQKTEGAGDDIDSVLKSLDAIATK